MKKDNLRNFIILTILAIVGVGYHFLTPVVYTAIVYGDSMYPTFSEQEVIYYITPKSSEDIKVGDIIIYEHPEIQRRMVVHRVIAINDGLYLVKGDNMILPDKSLLRFKDIKGKVIENE